MATEPTSAYVVINGLKLHYVEWGDANATPMVMLHGLRAYAHWFDEFAAVVKDRFRVLALDQRGRGNSEWAADGDYSREAYVSDLAAFIDALGLDKVVLVGHSMGGLNCLHYAAREPETVLAFIDVDIGPEIAPDGMARIRKELGATPDRFASWDEAAAFLKTNHARASAANRETRRQWMFREGANGAIEWRLDPAIFDPKIRQDPVEHTWSALTEIRCPTLIVRGGITDILTSEACDEMVARMPNCRWVEIPDAGHLVIEDNPDAFNTAALEFLQNDVSPIL